VHVCFHVELFGRFVVLQRDKVLPQFVVVLVQLAGAVINNLINMEKIIRKIRKLEILTRLSERQQ
jgi:hypothetical protein